MVKCFENLSLRSTINLNFYTNKTARNTILNAVIISNEKIRDKDELIIDLQVAQRITTEIEKKQLFFTQPLNLILKFQMTIKGKKKEVLKK